MEKPKKPPIQAILNNCSSGLYVITSHSNGKINGQISDALMQVTALPPRVVLSMAKEELTHEYILKSKTFAASILKQKAPLSLIRHFGFQSGRKVDKFSEIPYKLGATGCPLLVEEVVVTFEVKIFQSFDLGTHTLFIGEVVTGETLSKEEILTYGYYRHILKKKLHKNSPSTIPGGSHGG